MLLVDAPLRFVLLLLPLPAFFGQREFCCASRSSRSTVRAFCRDSTGQFERPLARVVRRRFGESVPAAPAIAGVPRPARSIVIRVRPIERRDTGALIDVLLGFVLLFLPLPTFFGQRATLRFEVSRLSGKLLSLLVGAPPHLFLLGFPLPGTAQQWHSVAIQAVAVCCQGVAVPFRTRRLGRPVLHVVRSTCRCVSSCWLCQRRRSSATRVPL